MRMKKWYLVSLAVCTLLTAAYGQKQAAADAEQPVENEFLDRESTDLGLFKVYYPDAWKYDEENMQKEMCIRDRPMIMKPFFPGFRISLRWSGGRYGSI